MTSWYNPHPQYFPGYAYVYECSYTLNKISIKFKAFFDMIAQDATIRDQHEMLLKIFPDLIILRWSSFRTFTLQLYLYILGLRVFHI